MTTPLVVVLVAGTVLGLLFLAVALVRATDRLRATTERLLAARATLAPRLDELRTEADRARAHAERIRTTGLRRGDRAMTDD